MPPKSQAQRRWAYATAEGKTDAAPSVGKEFLGHGITGLPEHVGKKDPPPKPHSALTAETGMAKGTRRGRSVKSAAKMRAGGHAALHTQMNQAYAKGDHAAAKTHALNFAKALHTASGAGGNGALTSSSTTVGNMDPGGMDQADSSAASPMTTQASTPKSTSNLTALSGQRSGPNPKLLAQLKSMPR